MKLHRNQSGFGVVEVLIIVVIVGLLGVVGWLVYDRQKTKDSAQEKKEITSFEECAAAGNPIMESYPEQCAADGKTFTNTKQAPIDEIQHWLTFTPADKAYTIRIPDGWNGISLNGNVYVRDVAKLEYKPGTKAVIEVLTEGGWDGASPFSLYNPGSYADQIVREGSQVATLTTTGGVKAQKYVFVQEAQPDGIGYAKGDKVYNYYFDKDGKYLQIQHVVSVGQKDQSELVEKAIKTLTF